MNHAQAGDYDTGMTLHTCYIGPLCADAEHDCPREAFLDDPITVAYGVGSEMLHLIACAVCDRPGNPCPHPSCERIVLEDCDACLDAAMAAMAAGDVR